MAARETAHRSAPAAALASPDSLEAPRRDRRRERNRERVLECAEALVRQGGLASLSVASVARAAGLHPPNFYALFPNLDALIEATAERVAERAGRHLATIHAYYRALGPEADFEQGAIENIRHALAFWLQDRALAEIVVRQRWDVMSPIGARVREGMRRYVDLLARTLWMRSVRAGHDELSLEPFVQLAELRVELFLSGLAQLLFEPGRELDAVATHVGRAGHDLEAALAARLRRC